jgi:hypothetical protein
VLFIVTSLSLGILTAQKSKSLVEKELRFNPIQASQAPAQPASQAAPAVEEAAASITETKAPETTQPSA